METRCHLGKVLRYDTVSKLKWGVDIRTHPISVVVDKLLAEDWEDETAAPEDGESTSGVPALQEEKDCSVRHPTRSPLISMLTRTTKGLL